MTQSLSLAYLVTILLSNSQCWQRVGCHIQSKRAHCAAAWIQESGIFTCFVTFSIRRNIKYYEKEISTCQAQCQHTPDNWSWEEVCPEKSDSCYYKKYYAKILSPLMGAKASYEVGLKSRHARGCPCPTKMSILRHKVSFQPFPPSSYALLFRICCSIFK